MNAQAAFVIFLQHVVFLPPRFPHPILPHYISIGITKRYYLHDLIVHGHIVPILLKICVNLSNIHSNLCVRLFVNSFYVKFCVWSCCTPDS